LALYHRVDANFLIFLRESWGHDLFGRMIRKSVFK
jgi:hypothetical protein